MYGIISPVKLKPLQGSVFMERKVYFSRLLDFYGALLPEKQQACMSQYYYDDLSLAEVSENLGITRQGVRDCIKRGEATLEKTESVLNLVSAYGGTENRLHEYASELKKLADRSEAEDISGDLRELADKLDSWDVY